MVSRKEAITVKLNQVTEDVLKVIDSYGFKQEGAYNLRLNGVWLSVMVTAAILLL